MQVPKFGSHEPLQQSVSAAQPVPAAPPEGPPQSPSHVPHEPLQQSASLLHAAPSDAPEGPPHVLVHVPQLVPPQQSALLAQPAPGPAQPHVPFAHVPLQQSAALPQLAPSCPPEGPPHVLSHVPQATPPQHSAFEVQLPPTSEHAFSHLPPVQTSAPQQSLSLLQLSPVPRQPHVPLPLHTLGAQHSLLLEQDVPAPPHPQVDVLASHARAPQQSPLLAHP